MIIRLVLGVIISGITAQFDRSGCGSLKGCVTWPDGCMQTGNCRMFFSYLQDQDYLAMEIFGQQGMSTSSQYYAVGFSTDMSMGDDTVVFCQTINGITRAGLAYNGLTKGSNDIIAVNQASLSNGGIYCSLRQRLSPGAPNVRNLNDSYYILASSGAVQGDGRLSYHNNDRAVLSHVDLRQYVRSGSNVIVNPSVEKNDGLISFSVQGTGVQPFSMDRPLKDWLKIIHAILMSVSWGILLSTGILFARHFKKHWPESTFCGIKLWFAYHRTLNSIGLLLSIIGVVAIFWAFDWTWQGPAPGLSIDENINSGSMHCLLGAVACIIGWLQPVNALCRCKPDSSARFIFNWIHRLLGLFGFTCAMAAITITAFRFNTMYLNMDAATSVWSAYLVILIITEVILEVLTIKRWCVSSTSVASEKEKEDGPSTSTSQTSGFSNAQSYVMLFYFVMAIILVAALSVLVFFKPVRNG